MQRQAYHTAIKTLYHLQCEASLPQEIRTQIPRANAHRWRSQSPNRYLGHQIASEQLKLMQQFARHQNAQRVFRAYLRIALVLKTIFFSLPKAKRHLKNHLATNIETAERVKPVIGIKSFLKTLNISTSTYQNWKARHLYNCLGSAIALCIKRHPQQATFHEITTLNKLLLHPDHQHWPISSIAAYARRTGQLLLSNQTIYKYARLFNHRQQPSKPNQNRISIRATQPGQILHSDVTEFRTADGIRHFIYIVMDNFSRKILSWEVADQLRGAIRLNTLRAAWELIKNRYPKPQLICDGGSENHNQTIATFLQDEAKDLQYLTARKEVAFSNSMVEAIFKILKSRYIRAKAPPNGAALQKVMAWAIQDYNDIRPHSSISDLTPSEAFAGMKQDRLAISQKLKTARRARIQKNLKNQCGICTE